MNCGRSKKLQKEFAKSIVSLPVGTLISISGFFAVGSLFSASDGASLSKLRAAIVAAVVLAVLAGAICFWLNLRWLIQARKRRQESFAAAVIVLASLNLVACAGIAGLVLYIIIRP